MLSSKWIIGAFASLTLTLSTGTQASVANTYTTYDFVGKCTDCEGYGRAHLTLVNYNFGDAITVGGIQAIFNEDNTSIIGWANQPANFVSFEYEGSNLFRAFSITADDAGAHARGVISSAQDSQFSLQVSKLTGTNSPFGDPVQVYFMSNENGDWSLGDIYLRPIGAAPADYGTAGTWVQANSNQVPEPSTLALLSLAGLALGARRKSWI